MSSHRDLKKSHLRKSLIESNLESPPITVPDSDSLRPPWSLKPRLSPAQPVLARPVPDPTGSRDNRPGGSPAPSRHSWRAIADYLWMGILVVLALLVFALVTPWSPYRVYAVRSGSMSPAFKVGDVIIVGPPPATLQEGTIITFQSGENQLTTHRIVGIVDGNYLQTKGDANEEPDVDLVPLDRVKKAFIFRIPYLGYVGHLIRTPLGWLLFVITPASLIIYGEIKNIVAALRPADHPIGRKAE